MPERDYYKVLGVKPDATQDQIRKVYRRLAKEHHPDRQGGSKAAEERFKEIAEAYGVLGDPEKRKQYDRLRQAGMDGGVFGGMGDFGHTFRGGPRTQWSAGQGVRFEDLGDLGSLFEQMFGGAQGGAQGGGRRRGRDISSSVTISFDMAVRGGKVQVAIPREEACPSCKGSGAAPGSKVSNCQQCGGRGQVLSGQGGFSVARPCTACFGRGRIIDKPCRTCRGSGSVENAARVEVTIPKGIRDGQRMRLAGLGESGSGGAQAGDLLLEVHVEPHPKFERKGRDIHSKVTVSMADAALGTEVDVATLHGDVNVKVPPGIQPGRRLRVKGYGLETSDGRRGDHYVEIEVSIPRKLSAEQKRLLEQFRRAPTPSRS
jgi:molecular chaperone DnaJ